MATMVFSTEQTLAGAVQLQFSIGIQITGEKRREKKNPIVEINDCSLRVPKKEKAIMRFPISRRICRIRSTWLMLFH